MTTTTGNNVGSVTTTAVTNVTTTVNSSTNITTTASVNTTIIGETAYTYMRAKTIEFSAAGLKPNTQYYPFFNGVYVGQFCSSTSGALTSTLKTNAVGDLIGKFYLPSGTFLAGSHVFSLVDNVRLVNGVNVPDAIYGQAEARYEANGVLKQQQSQITLNTSANTTTTATTTASTNVTTALQVPVATSVTSNPQAPVTPPPVQQCESWFFEYAVTSGANAITFTVNTNSVNPPSTTAVRLQSGGSVPGGLNPSSIRYISTSAGTSGWYHTFTGRTSPSGGTAVVKTYRQEWAGPVGGTRPSLTNFKPSGLVSSDSVVITTPWTLVGKVACPVQAGLGTPALVTTTNVAPYDPLAQSFFIEASKYPEGVFVTSIAVYFKTVDQSTPVTLELRNMVNGLPGSSVFPGGVALLPGRAAAQSPNATVATVFKFAQPIFLLPNDEYCFVVKSPSLGYNAWCSKLGEIDKTTGKVIDANPFSGTLFMSENNYTWTPDQTQDMKFDLYVAEFDTSKTGDVIVKPQLDTANSIYHGTAQNLPLSFMSTTKGSKVVKVKIPMHNLVASDKIYITGIASLDSLDPTVGYNNILAADLNGVHFVTQVIDEDTITFTTTGNNATKTGSLSTADLTLPHNIVPPVTITAASITNALPMVNTGTLAPSTIPAASTVTSPTEPTITSNTSFVVYTNIQVNEVMVDFMATEMDQTSIAEYISIATGTSTAGTEVPYGYQPYDQLTETKNFHSFDEPRMVATPLNETIHITELLSNKSATVNMKLTSSNKNVSPVIDVNGMSLMARTYVIDNQNGELDSLTLESEFNDSTLNSETNPGTGNALAKYKTIVRSLTDFHNKITLFVTANVASPAIIDAYVRTSSDRETHADQNWVWMPLDGVFGTPFVNSSNKLVTNEWMYELTTNDPFNVYDIKLVMRSTNNSVVPKIYGIRTITQFA